MSDVKLIRYDAACKAIADAKRVDEVKQIRDISIAMRAYARQADNRDLEAHAIEIRMRATRRMDQMRRQQKATVGLNTGARGVGTKVRVDKKPTLAETGIDKNLANEGRKLGALSEREFEKAVTTAREAVGRLVREALRTDDKKQRRAARERELGAKQQALPNKKYGVIVADPEWRFETWSEAGMNRAADNHYPTSSLEIIAARDWRVGFLLPDALCFSARTKAWADTATPHGRLIAAFERDLAGDFWPKQWQWYDQGGADAVAHYLATLDLSGFEARPLPVAVVDPIATGSAARAEEHAEGRHGQSAIVGSAAEWCAGIYAGWIADQHC